MIALAKKKNELQSEYEAVEARIAEHEASHAARRAAVAGDYDESAYHQAVAAAHAAYQAAMDHIAHQRALAQEGKVDFERQIAEKVKNAAEARDAKNAEIEGLIAHAHAEKEKAVADIEAGKVAAQAAHDEKVAAIRAECAAVAEVDQANYDRVAGEIKVIAEHLLALNERMTEKLNALANL
jgi:hypothetical protein